jgi:dTDP-4-dehydrorhamnose 3,5-epimerase
MVELSEDNKRQFFIPRGFAHGFLVLSEEAIFTYKVDNVYAPQAEAGVCWNDPVLDIKWPINPKEVLTSEKDLQQPLLKDAVVFD